MLTDRTELGAWLRLLSTPGIGPATLRRLLSLCGPPQAVLAQDDATLREVLSDAQCPALREDQPLHAALLERTWQWLQASNPGWAHGLVCLGDPDYPEALLNLPDPPCLLHAQGQLAALPDWNPERCVAIVGSRNPTPQGRGHAQAFAEALAAAGLCVVSGLALGIDGAAHEGALAGALAGPSVATVAVVGRGLDQVYPVRHAELARRILAQGLVLSEYPLGTPPLAAHFPQRNRLIAGLTRATLVVEAALDSGSLITARMALEQGAEVMAIPGSIHSPQSRGCHALIKQGATLVESVQDVLEALQWSLPHALAGHRSGPGQTPALDPLQQDLLTQMGHDPVSLDALQQRTGLDMASLQSALLTLELGGQLARLPGGRVQRLTPH